MRNCPELAESPFLGPDKMSITRKPQATVVQSVAVIAFGEMIAMGVIGAITAVVAAQMTGGLFPISHGIFAVSASFIIGVGAGAVAAMVVTPLLYRKHMAVALLIVNSISLLAALGYVMFAPKGVWWPLPSAIPATTAACGTAVILRFMLPNALRPAGNRCPACDYPLNHLPQRRCPECGWRPNRQKGNRNL